ncbi:hypothetical protein DIS18_00400 [Algibacter marinivivus]|uniref:Peptidase S1 domain-containing protein n=1 Tax=Algibacter marinivivus TaxID=2100723 RepID=A0A2U2X5N1_9FLAO|nr:trypsin-like serine protease [Algibacter marinivivus]PWH83050.1 hypothetical protein DIS18_00400 [Algibacter marinivivus]
MTEKEANEKLNSKEKETEYFNLSALHETQYAAVIKKSNDFSIIDDYAIEIGLSNFTYEYDSLKGLFGYFSKKEGMSLETQKDFQNGDIFPVKSNPISLHSNSSYYQKLEKLTGGCSISYENGDIYSGTAGAFFKLSDSQNIYMISNRHVIVDNDYGLETKIIHPSKTDAEKKEDISLIGKVFWTSKEKDDLLDAAIAIIYDEKTTVDIGKYSISNQLNFNSIAAPKIGQNIKKIGKTSGVTFGEIKSINCTVNITENIKKPKIYRKQILTTCISKPGDSGSVLLNNNNEVVGLLFGGNKLTASFSNNIMNIFNPIHPEINNFSKFV